MKKLTTLLLLLSFIPGLQAQDKWSKARNSIVLLHNGDRMIPLDNPEGAHIAIISAEKSPMFDSIAGKYASVASFSISSDWNDMNDRLKLYRHIIIRLSPQTIFTRPLLDFIRERRAIVVIPGSRASLAYLKEVTTPVIWYPEDTPEGASAAAQAIFGGIAAPQSRKTRLGYAAPETHGMAADSLARIDDIMAAAIAGRATPGGVVLVVKDGDVVFEKAWGHQTYSGTRAVRTDDLYDLASVTKIAATTPAIMKLYDEARLSLQSPVSRYVARARTISDKKDIRIREALLHEAGYTPYIKHFEKLLPQDLSTDSSAAYPVKVADGYYLRAGYFEEVMWPATLASPVLTRGKFVYSDVSMYMLREVIEKIVHRPMNEYLHDMLYRPLGLQTTGFLPRNRFDSTRIVPTTENDSWFRDMQLRGYAHDPGAAMAGGVSGHAGLFSDANDLAILYQMFLNQGVYGGKRYFKPATVALFTSRQSTVSHRALGFDRPDPDKKYPSAYASSLSYGHSGYTGTFVWVDPSSKMICIILTNRVYPEVTDNVNTLLRLNTRGLILDQVYRSTGKKNNSSTK